MPHRIAGCGGSEQFPSDQARFLPEPPAVICYIHRLGVQYSRCSLVHSPATALHIAAQLQPPHCAMASAPVSAALLLLAASAAAAQQGTLSSGSFMLQLQQHKVGQQAGTAGAAGGDCKPKQHRAEPSGRPAQAWRLAPGVYQVQPDGGLLPQALFACTVLPASFNPTGHGSLCCGITQRLHGVWSR